MFRYDCNGAASAAVAGGAPGVAIFSHEIFVAISASISAAVRKLREDSFAWWWRCGEYVVHRRVAYHTFGCGGYGSDAEIGADDGGLCYYSWVDG